ncbi:MULTISPECIES: DUF427 domain-containing protein [Croceibacter]|jgi:uncharacterized protein (DUF427 family)|uniref:DUF427 domain-containing protein n=1 Tax=Croceibacter atlanticus (strain ATCC BAA-628 / JCM 21780 / CIP 108009 / IAM 15332 / KCTC 12090 / HTCC2559) TaxID=216432 RepID=A3UB39_CROAH|nr:MULTISPECIES: DUF427 domain-containing protein [Croceibacter]EAP87025.1 hypothetical protein CA2559_13333 [Croceibacter atlanticus HTCC2559]MBG26968.1 nucleotidyltransferase domain-containing protein [Croceibacter sp.]MBW4970480.1 DUF427 domain-containing protein [Croceibacter atlanticus]WSP34579.1 DUF427 domain-containing protein [Croceibacter atlanticus]|tara:strand:+ start:158405 stop:158686 length:282 start_codon:yes stop_codon:yes gene_type:complete
MKAIWNNTVIAESNSTIIIENNHYFPPSSVNSAFLKPSETTTVCPWKGEASYYTIKVNEDINKNAAWYYPNPKEKASDIKDYVAFWKGVSITE